MAPLCGSSPWPSNDRSVRCPQQPPANFQLDQCMLSRLHRQSTQSQPRQPALETPIPRGHLASIGRPDSANHQQPCPGTSRLDPHFPRELPPDSDRFVSPGPLPRLALHSVGRSLPMLVHNSDFSPTPHSPLGKPPKPRPFAFAAPQHEYQNIKDVFLLCA